MSTRFIYILKTIKQLHLEGESFAQIKSITFKELRQQVKLYQIKLKSLGVKCGDRVVGKYKIIGLYFIQISLF